MPLKQRFYTIKRESVFLSHHRRTKDDGLQRSESAEEPADGWQPLSEACPERSRRVSKVDGSFRKTITRFIGDVYRFPNMLVENKIPPACGTNGEYRTQWRKPSPTGEAKCEHQAFSIQHLAL